jgi:predicted ATPase
MHKQLIKLVKISKLWGIKSIVTDFKSDVDIFIGANGTGKTTFLNLIKSVLLADFQILAGIEFESVVIQLQSEELINEICVTKKHNEYPIISYRFNNEDSLELPHPDFMTKAYMRSMRMNEISQSIKDKLNEFVNISWLSVHRAKNQDEFDMGRERNRNYVDERLDELMKKLTVYQLQLESEASKIAEENEERKQSIFSPINIYLDYLKKFMPNKEFKLDKESSGELEVRLKDKKNNAIKIPLFSLSSGEKQLVILFTETLLQRNEPFLFIADEPELSLHIEWQRQIIETLRGLNSNAQIIIATHSPEIAGKWKQNVINMENITRYEQ